MTVGLVSTFQRFQGLSTDDKPSSPREGSTYHAVDTGEEWVFMNGMWEEDLRLARALATPLN